MQPTTPDFTGMNFLTLEWNDDDKLVRVYNNNIFPVTVVLEKESCRVQMFFGDFLAPSPQGIDVIKVGFKDGLYEVGVLYGVSVWQFQESSVVKVVLHDSGNILVGVPPDAFIYTFDFPLTHPNSPEVRPSFTGDGKKVSPIEEAEMSFPEGVATSFAENKEEEEKKPVSTNRFQRTCSNKLCSERAFGTNKYCSLCHKSLPECLTKECWHKTHLPNGYCARCEIICTQEQEVEKVDNGPMTQCAYEFQERGKKNQCQNMCKKKFCNSCFTTLKEYTRRKYY